MRVEGHVGDRINISRQTDELVPVAHQARDDAEEYAQNRAEGSDDRAFNHENRSDAFAVRSDRTEYSDVPTPLHHNQNQCGRDIQSGYQNYQRNNEQPHPTFERQSIKQRSVGFLPILSRVGVSQTGADVRGDSPGIVDILDRKSVV